MGFIYLFGIKKKLKLNGMGITCGTGYQNSAWILGSSGAISSLLQRSVRRNLFSAAMHP